jgi:hypothetical protein
MKLLCLPFFNLLLDPLTLRTINLSDLDLDHF